MAKAVALVTLHVLARKAEVTADGKVLRPAEIEAKPPGSIVDLSDKEFGTMRDAGQVRVPTDDELTLEKASRGRKGRDDDDSGKAIAAAEKVVAAAKAAVDAADEAGKPAAEAALAAAEADLGKLKG